MSEFTMHTTEHSLFDDVPWYGDEETFRTIEACNDRIREISKMPRDNEISITVLQSGDVVKRQTLECKL